MSYYRLFARRNNTKLCVVPANEVGVITGKPVLSCDKPAELDDGAIVEGTVTNNTLTVVRVLFRGVPPGTIVFR